ncbi:MAG: YfhO family protein [Chloroflexi bacterium]|nr:YfhO family protein [Chloroflexota bacterium]
MNRIQNTLRKNPGDVLAILLLGSEPLIYFWQAALRQAVFFFGDISLFFYPVRLAYVNALRDLRLPLWAPEMMGGYPLFAEGQVAALYPPNIFLYALLPIDLATNYAILLHLSWVGLGMYAFLRALKFQPASACFAAFAFGGGGFFIARLVHLTILATASWMPWIFWAWEKRERENDRAKRWRWFALLSALGAVQLLAGHPQFALFTAALLAPYALVRWERSTKDASGAKGRERTRKDAKIDSSVFLRAFRALHSYFDFSRLIPVILFFGIGALIAGVQIVPTYELTTLSDRASGLLPRFFNAYSLRLPHYLMLFDPFLFGNPYPGISVETIGYIGLLPILLAIAAPFLRRNRRVVFFLLVALFSLFMASGDQNVFYRGLRYLPVLNFFRVPARFFFWFSFAAAILAATTAEYFLRRAPASARWARAHKAGIAGAVVLIALIIGLAPFAPVEFFLGVWTYLPLMLFVVAAWIILSARRGLLTRAALIVAMLGITVIDLALFGAVYAKTYNATTSVADFYAPPQSLTALKNLSPQGPRALTDYWIEPWISVMRESLFSNSSMRFGIASARAYTPLLLERNEEFLNNMNATMLNLIGVKYFLKPQLLPVDAATEGNDLKNDYALDLTGFGATFTPTAASKIRIASSLAQSVGFPTGYAVANVNLFLDDGTRQTLTLRAGIETAEWAYERRDVRAQTKHALPPIATTFPASSAFPVEQHLGHTFLGEYDLVHAGKPVTITGMSIEPIIARGLLHIERIDLIAPDGSAVSVAHLLRQSDQQLVYRTNAVAIYENADALPRAFIAHRAQIVDDKAALARMRRDDFDPRALLILAEGDALNGDGAQRADERVEISEYKTDRVVIDARLSAPGYLALTDTWYPGWVARVNGIETPIRRADYIFRAVRLDAGTHRVEFEYRPMSLGIGAVFSAVGLIALMIAVWLGRRTN